MVEFKADNLARFQEWQMRFAQIQNPFDDLQATRQVIPERLTFEVFCEAKQAIDEFGTQKIKQILQVEPHVRITGAIPCIQSQ